MSADSFTIPYKTVANIQFSNATGMRKHLESEHEIWRSFLETSLIDDSLASVELRQGHGRTAINKDCFENFLNSLNDPAKFNRLMSTHGSAAFLPPPSASIEGQLILGLHENLRISEAQAAFTAFLGLQFGVNSSGNGRIQNIVNKGRTLIDAAYAAEALPFHKVSSQKLAGAVRSAEANVASLDNEVLDAQLTNKEHETGLTALRANWKERAERYEQLFVRREKHRRKQYTDWREGIDTEVADRFAQAEKKLDAIDRTNRQKQENRKKEFDELKDLFEAQLRLRAPVELWEKREDKHSRKARWAVGLFILFAVASITACIYLPFLFGDYIADSFFTEICEASDPAVCKRVFSAKGPLTVSGILVVMSLVLWAVRLQYKVFLSERHLALDAGEKKAFAETFLAMRHGENVGAENEAIVLASLFRPTQDGIIKDDEGSMDLSAAAILAKQLGSTKQ